uniref:GLTP domain-containing protein n=1 Tax=Globodera pallida TaxID=36090 RepID=A0A183CJX1_GLOPA
MVWAMPFNTRWATSRVSAIFDRFVLKCQFTWIMGELARQNILRQKRVHLSNAKREIKKACLKITQDDLKYFTATICQHFVGRDTFLTPDATMSEFDNFVAQLNAVTERLPNDGAEEINKAANFIFSQHNMMGHVGDIRKASANRPSTSGSMGQPPTSGSMGQTSRK